MSNKKISDLTAASSVDAADLFEIEQGGTSKQATAAMINPFYTASSPVIHAQIITLPTTPVEVIAAPGANILLIPLICVVRMNWTADYSNINANAFLQITHGTSAVLSRLSQLTLSSVSALLAGGGPDGALAFFTVEQMALATTTTATPAVDAHFHRGAATSNVYDSDIVNKPLKISANNQGDSDFEDGDPANTLIIGVTYMKWNILTGVFM